MALWIDPLLFFAQTASKRITRWDPGGAQGRSSGVLDRYFSFVYRWKGKAEGEKGRRRGTGREEEREKNKEKGSRYTPPPDRPHLMRPLVIIIHVIIMTSHYYNSL